MAQARYYSSIAEDTTLTATVASGATVLPVAATTGFPASFPYTLVIEPDTANQEIVTVTEAAGLNLTVTRGEDGTGAVAHDAGAVVSHQHTARDFTESRQHEDATTGVHGVTGALVGTTATQALTNKDLSSATNTFPSTLATDAELADHTGATAAHGVTGDVVGTTDTQTLSGKTLADPVITESTGWTAYTPTWTATTTDPSIGDGTIEGAYKKTGRTVHFRVTITAGSTTTFGSGVWFVSLPVAAAATAALGGARLNHDSTNYAGSIYTESGELSKCRILYSGGSATASTPWTWDTGDVVQIQGTYETTS